MSNSQILKIRIIFEIFNSKIPYILVVAVIFYLFWISNIIAVIYYIYFLAGIKAYKPFPIDPLVIRPVSIVIAARNELQNLKKLLPALYRQDHQEFEIIVVDDRSEDGTREFLQQEAENVGHKKLISISIDHLEENIDGKKFALTKGIEMANYGLIQLIDADCIPASDSWLKTMSGNFDRDTSIVLGYSQYKEYPGWLNYFIRFETLFTGMQYASMAIWGSPYMGVGRNLSFKKDFFIKKGGYKDFMNVVGGDDDLFVNRNANANNTKMVIGKEALVMSEPKQSKKEYRVQKERHLSVGKLYGRKDKIILGIFSLSNIVSWLTFIPLILSVYPLPIIGVLLTRFVFLSFLFKNVSRKFGEEFNAMGVPILDLIYQYYYIVIGSKALLSKRTEWT